MRSGKGFTLIEVVVAMVVFGLSATALFGLFSKSTFNLARIEDLHRYQLAGEDIMKRALFLPSLPASGHAEGEMRNLKAHWVVDVVPYAPNVLESKPPEAVMKINVHVAFAGRAGERRISLESLRPVPVEYEDYDLVKAIENAYPR
jgi:prepilin-type N-terminal cleavage/methylation domain-containing protein